MSLEQLPGGQPARLVTRNLSLSWGSKRIISEMDFALPQGEFTVIIGPNGCGKSTLLRALSRGMTPSGGEVLLDGKNIQQEKPRQIARELALLTQGPTTGDALTVYDLVARGRYPHQTFFRQWSAEDERVVAQALQAVDLLPLAQRMVAELSGGQRQRVWFAMTLAQQTPIVLLDEPTTYLDIAHQIELLDLCEQLHQQGKTLALVLHDLNLALRYASWLVMMKEGAIYAQGLPQQIVTENSINEVFGLSCRIISDPESGKPLIIPRYQRGIIQK
ncbi:ABC transporter ATP-binding protein [Pseudomonas graminis]